MEHSLLQRLQNKCLKTCFSYHRLCETKVIHRETKCAYLNDRREVHTNNFMYKRLEKGVHKDNRDIHTRQHDAPLFTIPFPNNEAFKMSVQFSGANVWNELAVNVRSINPYDAFKVHQKRKLSLSYQ